MASRAVLDLIVSLKDEASRGLERIGGAVGRVGALAGGAAIAGVGGLAVGLGAAAVQGLQFNSSMEIVEAQLFAFLKDADAVDGALAMIQERAASTPFAFEEMAQAMVALQPAARASGQDIEGLIETAEILAASNPAEGLEGAAFALKEALSGDFTSIIERFNLPRQRLKELREQGVPDIEAVRIAMGELGLDTSLVTGLAETASGRWSTFQDTLTGLAATATSGLFEGMSESMARVNEALADPAMQENLNAIATAIGERLASAFNWLISTGVPMLQSGFQLLKDAVTTFQQALAGDWADSTIVHPFHRIVGAVGLAIPPIVEFATTHAEALKGALIGIGAVLAGAAIVGGITSLAATIATLATPIGLIVVAVGVLSAAWAGNWGGIQEKTAAAWAAVQPVLAMLQEWLAINLPIAIQALSDFWNNTLLPAIQQVAGFIQTSVVPLLMSLANVVIAAVVTASEGLAALWSTVLQPALASLATFVSTTVAPALSSFNTNVIQPLYASFGGISGAIQTVIGWLDTLAEKINSIDFGVLMPGSPTPFELGIRGITDAMRELSTTGAPMLASTFDSPMMASGGSFGGAAGGVVINLNGVSLRSEEDIDALAYQLARHIRDRR